MIPTGIAATTITGGTLTKVVHNRKYMEENPNIDTSKLKDEDLHDWKLVGKVVQPTLEKEGYADYICSIDKCGPDQACGAAQTDPGTQ